MEKKASDSSTTQQATITHISEAQSIKPEIPPVRLATACNSNLELNHLFDDDEGDNQKGAMHWSIPWSDLMMVMFVMFAILFVFKEGKEQKIEKPVPHNVSYTLSNNSPVLKEPTFGLISPQSIYRSSADAIEAAKLDMVDIVLQEDQSIKVSVQGPMFFDSGKADLKLQTKSFLDSLAPIIARTPYAVQIVGHTDNHPIVSYMFPSNWELSVVRATRIARYLIEYGGLEPSRFMVSGYSMYKPIVPNSSETNKAKNRRVEIIITRDKFLTQKNGVLL